ncbi:aldehyde dehydrogenase [Schumannella sp. 10F1B-5-1]|uniref:aldehyde dehydrogenase n=1 Tax=Schumannella sp. 10F1B-5-1 TaxID=2590780 RepID=UPI0011318F92|nr:aldehyde dehydrogenase [Schumannella sp. 10F1B-5-1]TPW78244.1 aldehyde dehydrogenase [Schumannella sp. 10F1B-5-1]
MSGARVAAPLAHPEALFIDGEWRVPSTDSTIAVEDATTEEVFLRVAEAREADVDAAIAAARTAFDLGPWPRLTHAERAGYLQAIADALEARLADAAGLWVRESGIVHAAAQASVARVPQTFARHARLADDYPFEERHAPTAGGEYGLLVREPVGVVAAIVPWNVPLGLAAHKIAPALLAGCAIVLKASPEAPGSAYLLAEIAEQVGLPAGVLNVVTADREVSERLVRDPRVDKIAFTGSTAAGRRIAAIAGDRIARYTLELGGKSAAVILDDFDLGQAAKTLAGAECFLSGQVCSSITRIVVDRARHDDFVDALAAEFAAVRVGDPFADGVGMGPLAIERQRDRVLDLVAQAKAEGSRLATGGGVPEGLERGWFVEPTVFAGVDSQATIAREEVFGPVLTVLPADGEDDAVRIANDSIYGLNASVFTNDADRALAVARRLRSGTVGHNAYRTDYGIAFGGVKQSGVGREGGREGIAAYLETKTIILDAVPMRSDSASDVEGAA